MDGVEQVHRIFNVAFHALLARQIGLTGHKTIPRDFKFHRPGWVADVKTISGTDARHARDLHSGINVGNSSAKVGQLYQREVTNHTTTRDDVHE